MGWLFSLVGVAFQGVHADLLVTDDRPYGPAQPLSAPARRVRAGERHVRQRAHAFALPARTGAKSPRIRRRPSRRHHLCRQGVNVVTYVYELHGEEVKVKKIEHTKSQPQAA